MKYSLHEHLEIKWLIFFSAIVSASTLNMVWFIQVYWEKTQVPIWMFGILWAALQVVSAFVARHAHQIEEILGRKVSLLAMIVMPIIGYAFLSAAMTAWAGLFMILFYVTRGMNDPITKSYINGLIFSDDRATILSVRNFVGRLMFCVTGLLTGWVHDAYSLQSALALSSLIFFVGGAICLIFLKRHKAL
jgi:MFS family permease